MFKQYRINKLKIKIAGKQIRHDRLIDLISKCINKIPGLLLEDLLETEETLAELKEKLKQLES